MNEEKLPMPRCDIDRLQKDVSRLKSVIEKMCMELVEDDDDMSLGLAEHFSQELLLEMREVLK